MPALPLTPTRTKFRQRMLVKMRPFRVGRPKSANPKEHVNLRLDPKVLEFFRSGVPGWKTRVNETLLRYVARQLAKG